MSLAALAFFLSSRSLTANLATGVLASLSYGPMPLVSSTGALSVAAFLSPTPTADELSLVTFALNARYDALPCCTLVSLMAAFQWLRSEPHSERHAGRHSGFGLMDPPRDRDQSVGLGHGHRHGRAQPW